MLGSKNARSDECRLQISLKQRLETTPREGEKVEVLLLARVFIDDCTGCLRF